MIGNQVDTDGGPIDILCVDAAGDLAPSVEATDPWSWVAVIVA